MMHCRTAEMVIWEPDSSRKGDFKSSRCDSGKSDAGDSGDGNCEADHPGILSGKVGRADEKKRN